MPSERFEGPYNRNEAQHEANMLRARLGISPEDTAKLPRDKRKGPDRFDRETTAEDYKAALKELRELQAHAPDDPEIKKILKELEKEEERFTKQERHGTVI